MNSSDSMTIGGDLRFRRLGFGTMRLPGPGIWGPPTDRDRAIAVLRRAVELGVDLIDTADSYGPAVAEELIHEALHPYPDHVVIATKAGLLRPGPIEHPGPWPRCGRPEYLRQQAELSLRRLHVDRIDLFFLHRIDPQVPFEEQLGALAQLVAEGKVRHMGLSGVTLDELRTAAAAMPIAAVQNRFGLADRSGADVLAHAVQEGMAFVPFAPLGAGATLAPRLRAVVDAVAARHRATPAQVALAWLLGVAPVTAPIPGTSQPHHLEENIGASGLELTPAELQELSDAGASA